MLLNFNSPIWQKVMQYQLDTCFRESEPSIKECLLHNLNAIFDLMNDKTDLEMIDNALVKLPKMFWKLLDANDNYRRLQKQNLSTSKHAESIIGLYSTVANGTFIDALRILSAFEELITDKKLDQSKLGGAIECITSKRLIETDRDYRPFTDLVTKDMRNASDHGGIIVRSIDYSLTFTDKHIEKTIYKSFSEVESELQRMLSGLSAFLQTILEIIRILNIVWLPVNAENPEQELIAWNRLLLSTPKVLCHLVETRTLADNRLQFLATFSGIDTDSDAKLWFCLWSAIYTLQYIVPPSQKINRLFMIYESPRAISSSIAVSGGAISQYISNKITFEELLEDATQDNVITWPTNTDSTPIQHIQYEDIVTDDYAIKNIENPNTESQIRFVADVELSRVTRPNHVKALVPSIISVMQSLPSGGDMKIQTKHGMMPADIVFLRIFHDEEGKKNTPIVKLSATNDDLSNNWYR